MEWYLLAGASPLLFALTNHIDKSLLSNYFTDHGVGALLIFSALASFLALPLFLIFGESLDTLDLIQTVVIIICAVLNVVLLWCYLSAMEADEPSIVIIFYQLVPVFGVALGFLILNEQLSFVQMAAMVVVLFGTGISAVELSGSSRRIRTRSALFMVAASFCWAFSAVLFKVVALETNATTTLFFEHLILGIFGLAVFAFSKRYRIGFLTVFRRASVPVLSLNLLNEGLYILGNVTAAFAYLMVPVSLVLLAEAYQPLFVFLIGVLLFFAGPRWATEQLTVAIAAQKLLSILVSGIGVYWLISAT